MQEFVIHMTRLRACYPQRVADAEHWKAMVARYWEELSKREPDTLTRTLAGAWKHHPQFFPSLGEVEALCDKVAKEIRDKRPKLAEATTPPGMTSALRDAVNAVKSL